MAFRFSIYPTKDDASKAHQGTRSQAGSLDELATAASASAWSPSLFFGDYRNNDNFEGCDLIGLDVDDGCTLGEALTHFAAFQHLIYTTKNHQKVKNPGTPKEKPACDRFRVVLVLDQPITTVHEYNLTWASLQRRFPFIDSKAKDAARFYFPGKSVSCVATGDLVKTVTSFSQRTRKFLRNGAAGGEWNAELYCAAKDVQEQLYTEEQAVELLEQPTRLPGNFGFLDEKDLATIRSAFKSPPGNPPRRPIGTEFDSEGNAVVTPASLVAELLTPYFVQQVTDDQTINYRISDPALRELTRCQNEDVLIRHLAAELARLPRELVDEAPRMKELLTYWRIYGDAITEPPATFAWPDEECWAIKRMTFSPEPGPFPAWQEFLSRLSDAPAFMAYVWSIFELKNKSRQALWLHGPRGQDGKSTVLRVLASCFGNAAAALNNAQVSSKSQFFLSNFYNKRMAIYPDAKNTKFPMSEIFRNLTSGDVVPIEFKGEGIINVQLYLKLLIGSNYEPELTSGNADLSRLIRIDVEQGAKTDDVDWEESLREQLPTFLYACRETYERLAPKHGQIKVSQETIERVRESAEQFQEQWAYIVEEYFLLGEDQRCTAMDVLRKLIVELGKSSQELGDFYKYLETHHSISRSRPRKTDGKRLTYLQGIAPKPLMTLHISGNKRS